MKKLFISSLISTALCFTFFFQTQTMPRLGDKAPSFSLRDENGNLVVLSDIKGKYALVFFPKALSISFGCKEQVCSIRNGFTDLADSGITVYGICDSDQKNLKKFATDNHLPFPLLHATKNILKTYGVKGFIGAKRYTFLIENGIIVGIITNVDTHNHATQILDTFNAIAKK